MRRFIDSHVHIEGFDDIESLRSDCIEAGVDGVICVGGDIDSSKRALEAAEAFPGFYFPAVGVHPSNLLKVDLEEAVGFLYESLGGCVALGEVGLDYSYDFARGGDVRARMREFFACFLGVGAEFGLPASVHSRGAYGDALGLVVEAGVDAVFHWFDGPLHVLRDVLDHGFFVSASAAVGYSRGVRDVLRVAPLERILVETDSPVFVRGLGRRSGPMDVVGVVEDLALLKGLNVGEVARVTLGNAVGLFGL